jgi:heat shock protein HslJ
MACPPATMQLELQFLNALEQTRSYQLNGPTLTLRNAANQPLATFTRK